MKLDRTCIEEIADFFRQPSISDKRDFQQLKQRDYACQKM